MFLIKSVWPCKTDFTDLEIVYIIKLITFEIFKSQNLYEGKATQWKNQAFQNKCIAEFSI